MREPLISIVMPSFNQGAYISEAIESVLSQDYPHKELLVIDGGSRREVVDIIRRYESRLAYWVSEKDRGQSHAINKGFAEAKGHLVSWLNSDDILLPGALSAVARQYQRGGLESNRWIAGECIWVDPHGHVLRCARGNACWHVLVRNGIVNVSGPSSFFTKDILDRLGMLDEDLHYMMDTELWLRFARSGLSYERTNRYLWALRLHPEAKMSGHNFAGSPMASSEHPVWTKRRLERQKIESKFGLTESHNRKAEFYSRLIRLATLTTPHALIDSYRWRGRPVQQIFV